MIPYFPRIGTSSLVNRYQIGEFEAHLLDNIESLGVVGYLYVLLIFPAGSDKPSFAVASEYSDEAMLTKPTLGTFNGRDHRSHGMSPSYADCDQFLKAAFQQAKEELGIPDDSEPVPLDTLAE